MRRPVTARTEEASPRRGEQVGSFRIEDGIGSPGIIEVDFVQCFKLIIFWLSG